MSYVDDRPTDELMGVGRDRRPARAVFSAQSLKFIFGTPLKLEREAHRRGVQREGDDDRGTLDNQPQNHRSNERSSLSLNDTVRLRPPAGPPRAKRTRGSAPGGHLRHVSQLVLVACRKKSVAIYDDDDDLHARIVTSVVGSFT